MPRVAVFVDAGYVYARGSDVAGCHGTGRQNILLDLQRFRHVLDKFLDQRTSVPLLRIYWYDGLPPSGNMSSDQSAIAVMDDFKLRLGQVNGAGKQKGVDSMIVTDMIELARNKGISDAVLLGGDDDLRVGVQVTQTFGVRVHVLGMGNDFNRSNVNRFLRQEADTAATWDDEMVKGFVSLRPGSDGTQLATDGCGRNTDDDRKTALIERAVEEFVKSMDRVQRNSIHHHRQINDDISIPADIDRALLKAVGESLGSRLDPHQKRAMRRLFNDRFRSEPVVT